MSRLIDADVLIETFKNTEDSDHCKWSTAGIVDEINFAPTVDAFPISELRQLYEEMSKIKYNNEGEKTVLWTCLAMLCDVEDDYKENTDGN